MSKETYKESSKSNLYRADGEFPNLEQLSFGCLQRIADATEVMAKNYNQLLADVEKYKKWYSEERAEKERLQRSLVAHKANYTRLKNKLEAMKQDVEYSK